METQDAKDLAQWLTKLHREETSHVSHLPLDILRCVCDIFLFDPESILLSALRSIERDTNVSTSKSLNAALDLLQKNYREWTIAMKDDVYLRSYYGRLLKASKRLANAFARFPRHSDPQTFANGVNVLIARGTSASQIASHIAHFSFWMDIPMWIAYLDKVPLV